MNEIIFFHVRNKENGKSSLRLNGLRCTSRSAITIAIIIIQIKVFCILALSKMKSFHDVNVTYFKCFRKLTFPDCDWHHVFAQYSKRLDWLAKRDFLIGSVFGVSVEPVGNLVVQVIQELLNACLFAVHCVRHHVLVHCVPCPFGEPIAMLLLRPD